MKIGYNDIRGKKLHATGGIEGRDWSIKDEKQVDTGQSNIGKEHSRRKILIYERRFEICEEGQTEWMEYKIEPMPERKMINIQKN